MTWTNFPSNNNSIHVQLEILKRKCAQAYDVFCEIKITKLLYNKTIIFKHCKQDKSAFSLFSR